MTRSLLALRAPSANRVYTSAAGPLVLAEARWVLGAHLGSGVAVRERPVGGMPALEVSLPGGDPDAERELPALLSTLSATYGLFELVGDDPGESEEPLLRPLAVPSTLRHRDDLESILKYPGKTNEQFTALLVNLAAALSTRRAGLRDGSLRLLDPMAGRGTTLNRALRLGLSPVGAEIDRKDVDAYRAFLSTYLRTHRYKHTVAASRLSVRGEQLGTRVDVELAEDKRVQRETGGQRLTLLGCDTRRLGELLPDASIDALVADLPYGVQHGSRSAGGWDRSPLSVLEEVAPRWRALLRDGAGVALAVNRHTLGHADASRALEAAGLRLISHDGAFRHRVDQSIDRDVLLAVPTTHPRLEELTALGAATDTRPQEDPS